VARALVTGGAGFIGSNLVDRLVGLGHQVLALDDLSSGKRENVHPSASFAEADVRSAEAGAAIRGFKPDVLFHLAAQIDVRRSVEDPVYDASVNVLGIVNVLHACVSAGAKRVILAASGGTAYGEADDIPTDESAPVFPVSPYGISKVCSENYLGYYVRTAGIAAVSLRYANVYGPRQDPHGEAGVVAIFGGNLLTGKQCYIYGDGLQTRDYVHVSDVVAANIAAMERPSEGLHFANIGTGIETSVVDLFERIAALTDPGATPEYRPARAGELQRSALDATYAKTLLGWAPTLHLDQGLAQYIEWLRSGAR
jgi:UDP-glucose 4-epimerase